MSIKTDAVLAHARRRCLERGVRWTPELLDALREVVDPLVRSATVHEEEALDAHRRLAALRSATGERRATIE